MSGRAFRSSWVGIEPGEMHYRSNAVTILVEHLRIAAPHVEETAVELLPDAKWAALIESASPTMKKRSLLQLHHL
jgi:hypothetical protein